LYAVPSTMIEQVMEMKEKALAAIREDGEVEWQGNRYPFHFLPHLLGDAGRCPRRIASTGYCCCAPVRSGLPFWSMN
jgi:chemotaxis protein histidine kinase CheA